MAGPTVVFCGPSLRHDEARALAPGAVLLPPVCQGDLLSAVERYRPATVVVIDGEFGQNLSVWHKEILEVIAAGVRVVGASSMGALRAAELDRFGMEGVGAVYEHFRGGFLTADEDVAVIHTDAEHGWRPLTWPTVNIRATVAALQDAGLFDDADAHAVLDATASLHFSQRSRAGLTDRLARSGRSDAERLAGLLAEHHVDQKRLDAVAAVAAATVPPAAGRPPAETPRHLRGRIGDAMRHNDTLVPSTDVPLRRYQLVNDVALHLRDFEQLSQRALDRRATLELALEAGISPTAEECEAERARFLAARSIGEETLDRWLAENDLTPATFDELIAEEATRRRVQRWVLDTRLYEGNRKLVLDQLRIEGRYRAAVDAAAERRALADARPPHPWPDQPTMRDLVLRHVVAARWRPIDRLDVLAADHGMDDMGGLMHALLEATSARQERNARREARGQENGTPPALLAGALFAAMLPPRADPTGPVTRAAAVPSGTDPVAERPGPGDVAAARGAAATLHRLLEGHQVSAVTLAFAELGVADALAAGPLPTDALAARCGADPERLQRLLTAAAAIGLVGDGTGGWRTTAVGAALAADHPATFAPYAADLRDSSLPAWHRLAAVVRGGSPAAAYPGGADADGAVSAATWALGMDEHIPALFPVGYAGHVVDVGGGLGRTAAALAARCRSARVSLVELPQTAERAQGLAGVEVHTTDGFTGPVDAAVLCRVLCTLPEDAAVRLLTAVRDWLRPTSPDGGTPEVLVVDAVADGGLATALVDLFNLVRSDGTARRPEQWRSLAAAAGFTVAGIRPMAAPFSVVVLRPLHPGEAP